MERVKVYYFIKYDQAAGENRRSQRPATREAIERAGGVIVVESEKEVPTSELDGNGFYSFQ